MHNLRGLLFYKGYPATREGGGKGGFQRWRELSRCRGLQCVSGGRSGRPTSAVGGEGRVCDRISWLRTINEGLERPLYIYLSLDNLRTRG